MEIPLSLKKTADGRLVYGIPLWYRIMTGIMIALILGGMLTTAGSPGLIAWLILVLLVLGALYEEVWIVDPKARTVRHLGGLWPIARALVVNFDDVEEFALGCLCPRHRPRIDRGIGRQGESLRHDERQGFTNDAVEKAAFLDSWRRSKHLHQPGACRTQVTGEDLSHRHASRAPRKPASRKRRRRALRKPAEAEFTDKELDQARRPHKRPRRPPNMQSPIEKRGAARESETRSAGRPSSYYKTHAAAYDTGAKASCRRPPTRYPSLSALRSHVRFVVQETGYLVAALDLLELGPARACRHPCASSNGRRSSSRGAACPAKARRPSG